MFEVGRLVARLSLEGAAAVGRELRTVASEWKNLSDEGKHAATTVGTTMVGAGAALVATLGLVTKAAIDWESAWAGVTKTVEGSPAQLAAIEQGLRGLTQVLPASHAEIAGVAEAAGQLGVASEDVVSFTRTMVDLGETTNLSSDQAATSLARFMNVMGTSQDQVSNLGSAIVDLGNNYATTEAEIVEMAQRLAGAGRQIGLTEGEVLGLATSLSSVGIEAEAGGSAISKVMIDIAASVDKGGKKLDQFASVAGLSAEQFAAKWKKDPGEALSLFVKGLADVEAQGGSTFAVLESLGITEVRMRDALLRSAAAADQFAGAMDKGNEAFGENSALADEAAKRYATVESQIQMTANAVNDAAIDFGQVFMPAVLAVANAVKDVANFLGDLPPELQAVIGGAGLVTAAVLLFGGALLLTIPKIVEFRAATALLATELPRTAAAGRAFTSFLTGPWGLALAAAAVGVTILTTVLKDLQSTSAEVENSLRTAKSAAEVFDVISKGREWTWLRDVKSQLSDLPAVLEASAVQSENLFARFDSTHFGAFDALRDIGLELGKLSTTDLPSAQNAFRNLVAETDGSEQSIWRLINALGTDYMDALTAVATEQGLTADKATLIKLAMGEAESSTSTASEAYLEQADAVTALRDELTGLIEKMLEANGIGQDAVTANIEYQEALRGARERIAEIQAGTEGYALSLDTATQAGSDNVSALVELAQKSQAAAEAQFALDGNTQTLSSSLQMGRQEFYDTALAMSGSAEQAQILTDKIYGIPSEKEMEVIAKTAAAQSAIDSFVANNQGRTISMFVTTSGAAVSFDDVFKKADGGITYFAGGGVRRENHVAQFAQAGDWRVWAEPETGGEAYIPLSPNKRSRSMDVLAAVAGEFGYGLVPTGTPARTGSSSSGPSEITGTLRLADNGAGLVAMIDGTVSRRLDDENDAAVRGTSTR